MDFYITDNTNINGYSETTKSTGGKSIKANGPSFVNVFQNHLPKTNTTAADVARAMALEKRKMMNQMLEWMRTESETKRMELLSKLMQKDDEEPYDLFRKCLDIARRIMRGEKVTAEEMRLLAQHFPELLFQALLLKQEEKDLDEYENPEKDDELFETSDSSGSSAGAAIIADAS